MVSVTNIRKARRFHILFSLLIIGVMPVVNFISFGGACKNPVINKTFASIINFFMVYSCERFLCQGFLFFLVFRQASISLAPCFQASLL